MPTTNSPTVYDFTVDGGTVTIDGTPFDGPAAYEDAIGWLHRQAAAAGHPVLVTNHVGDDATWFTVAPDGAVTPATAPAPAAPAERTSSLAEAGPGSIQLLSPSPWEPQARPSAPREAGRFVDGGDASAEPAWPTPSMPAAPAPTDGEHTALPRRSDVRFVNPVKHRPHQGVRAVIYTATGGLVNLGPSPLEREMAELVQRISRKLTGSHSTAFLSLKGGVGKTSTTGGVGMILAEYRGDPPCAVDMNPDSGDLAERVVGEANYDRATAATVTDVVRDAGKISSLTDLSGYMHHANRLHVIAGEQDPAVSDAITADDHAVVQALVARYYGVVLTDCGTGVSHPAMAGILGSVSNLVIATGYAVSGAKRAAAVIDWLRDHGYTRLADTAIVVVTDKDGVSGQVNRTAIREHLEGVAAAVIEVPRDAAVADGDQISPDRVGHATRLAWMRIAAAIVDGYR